jgi:hypothetical protein
MFPELYSSVSFDYSAMWAYAYHYRFASIRKVLANSKAIKKMHPLKLGRFLAFAFIQSIAAARRTILDRISSYLRVETAPDDIQAFVEHLAKQENCIISDAAQPNATN